MFVKWIEVDSPEGEVVRSDPSMELILSEIRALNGESKDSLVLGTSGHSYMGVAGGRNNEYVVAGYLEGFGSFVGEIRSTTVGIKEVMVCGDPVPYPASNVVGLKDAMAMAEAFCISGELATQFDWVGEKK